MKPPAFRYLRPERLDEALSFLAEHPDAKPIAGGQSLMPMLAMRLARPEILVDLNRVPGQDAIALAEDHLATGMLVRHRDLEYSPAVRREVPLLAEAIRQVGHPQIRTRGTACGSVAHADPSAELPAVLLALGGAIIVQGSGGLRAVPPEEFFMGYFMTALAPGELVVSLHFPRRAPRSGSAFLEFSRRKGDFALVGVAANFLLGDDGRIADARIALTGVGGTAVRSQAAEALLRGEAPGEALWRAAGDAAAAEIEPDGDVHASADYRRHLGGVLTRRALALASERAIGGHSYGT